MSSTSLIRLAAIALLAPFWWPLLRTILRDFQDLLRGTGRISHTPRQWGDLPDEPPGDDLIEVSRDDGGPFRHVQGGGRRSGRGATRLRSGGSVQGPRGIVSRNAGRRRRGA